MKITIAPSNKNWYYTVKSSDENLDITSFIKRFNINEEEFYYLNKNIDKLVCGDVLLIPASQQYFHIVSPLETYQSIANKFNCSSEYLVETNKTKTLFVGQKIYIWFFVIVWYTKSRRKNGNKRIHRLNTRN